MLRRARLCHSKSSARLSVCLSVTVVEVCFLHRLEYFENNFTAEELKASALADLNMGNLVQQEHPKT